MIDFELSNFLFGFGSAMLVLLVIYLLVSFFKIKKVFEEVVVEK